MCVHNANPADATVLMLLLNEKGAEQLREKKWNRQAQCDTAKCKMLHPVSDDKGIETGYGYNSNKQVFEVLTATDLGQVIYLSEWSASKL